MWRSRRRRPRVRSGSREGSERDIYCLRLCCSFFSYGSQSENPAPRSGNNTSSDSTPRLWVLDQPCGRRRSAMRVTATLLLKWEARHIGRYRVLRDPVLSAQVPGCGFSRSRMGDVQQQVLEAHAFERLIQPQLDAIGVQYCDICNVYVYTSYSNGARHKTACR